ncbi:unnamed protein product [Pelagomonas calceolata]|uniref:Carrier domain-containing protein n=1 Tax=Pelagomonas calceolata TaxID=35677 RepID=A0A8J2S901_9STRA|nr:unnamed protein product [Pelagomonas calceolata]
MVSHRTMQNASAVIDTTSAAVLEVLGTKVTVDTPLMSAGLDSIAVTDLVNVLSKRFEIELPPTLLFDHPTIGSVATHITTLLPMEISKESVVETREGTLTPAIAGAIVAHPAAPQDQVFLSSHRMRFTLPGACCDALGLRELGLRAWSTNSHWPISRLAGIESPTSTAAYGSFLAPDAFASDAAFFGISRTEARAMDPMAMLVLETTYGALSSTSRADLANKPIGFFLGSCGWTGGQENASKIPKATSVYSGTSGALSVLSGRLSYTLGLTGPCQTTDTACSSSLVAAHQAVSALKLGESPAAAVAGVGVLTVSVSVAFSAAGMLSALGRCHTFDRRADGYCRGEGCGAFYFSTEADDVAVSGTAVQQDGPSASLTAPNGTSQQRLIEAVKAGSGPSLEAHGTGTALGDPIEVCAYFLFL